MDRLPPSVHLHILSLLDDSADVARCRVAFKTFNTVFPGLRSIKLWCSWYRNCDQRLKTLQNLISKLESVESVSLSVESCADSGFFSSGFYLKKWLPRVSGSLKSLSLSGVASIFYTDQSHVLPLVSVCCPNLVSLNLKWAKLCMDNMNPMPMLTTLTLAYISFKDQRLNEFNDQCFPNLQVLNLEAVRGLEYPKFHLLNLKTCCLSAFHNPASLTLITPNLILLEIDCKLPIALHLEAPMLSHFCLKITTLKHASALTVKKFQNLKTLYLESSYASSLLLEFPITKTVEKLTLVSGNKAPRDPADSKLDLEKVFTVFPNLSSLKLAPGTWSELEASLNLEDLEIRDGGKGLETICAYLDSVDPSLTFSCVARVLDQCVSLSEFSLLVHGDVVGAGFESLMSKCSARWPRLEWSWGLWSYETGVSWITDDSSN